MSSFAYFQVLFRPLFIIEAGHLAHTNLLQAYCSLYFIETWLITVVSL